MAKFTKSLGLSGLSPLSPEDQLGLAKSQYQDLIGKAMTGDLKAAQGVTGAASTLLEKGKGFFASGSGYFDLYNQVSSDLTGLTGFAGGAAQRNLIDAYTSRIAGLRDQQQSILRGFAGGGMTDAGESFRVHPGEMIITAGNLPAQVFNPRETAAILSGGNDNGALLAEQRKTNALLETLLNVMATTGRLTTEQQAQMAAILDAIRRKANLASADPMRAAA